MSMATLGILAGGGPFPGRVAAAAVAAGRRVFLVGLRGVCAAPGGRPEAREAADKVKAGIIDGSLHPFTGPIKDQKGDVKVAANATIPDDELLKLNWYVQGVQA